MENGKKTKEMAFKQYISYKMGLEKAHQKREQERIERFIKETAKTFSLTQEEVKKEMDEVLRS